MGTGSVEAYLTTGENALVTARIGDWRPLGPPFFLAGLAVTLASLPSLDRSKYLDLADELSSRYGVKRRPMSHGSGPCSCGRSV